MNSFLAQAIGPQKKSKRGSKGLEFGGVDQEGPVSLDNLIFPESGQLQKRGSREFDSEDDWACRGCFSMLLGLVRMMDLRLQLGHVPKMRLFLSQLRRGVDQFKLGTYSD